MFCKNCGNQIDDNDALFCMSCGVKISDTSIYKYCGHCGNMLEDDAVFCMKCGEKVREEQVQPAEENTHSPENEPQQDKVMSEKEIIAVQEIPTDIESKESESAQNVSSSSKIEINAQDTPPPQKSFIREKHQQGLLSPA